MALCCRLIANLSSRLLGCQIRPPSSTSSFLLPLPPPSLCIIQIRNGERGRENRAFSLSLSQIDFPRRQNIFTQNAPSERCKKADRSGMRGHILLVGKSRSRGARGPRERERERARQKKRKSQPAPPVFMKLDLGAAYVRSFFPRLSRLSGPIGAEIYEYNQQLALLWI